MPLLVAVLAGALFGLHGRTARWPAYALVLTTCYLGFTLAGKQMAEQRVQASITRQGIEVERMFSTPTPFNSLLWRVILVDGEHYYETLVSWWDDAPPALVRLPRNAHLADALDGSPQHERLRWFSGDVLRYDVDGDQLLVTDLRLGMTGFHPFRFPLAERSAEGWQLVERPERLPANRGNMRRLESIWQRIWQQEPALPLAAWAAELNGKTIR